MFDAVDPDCENAEAPAARHICRITWKQNQAPLEAAYSTPTGLGDLLRGATKISLRGELPQTSELGLQLAVGGGGDSAECALMGLDFHTTRAKTPMAIRLTTRPVGERLAPRVLLSS